MSPLITLIENTSGKERSRSVLPIEPRPGGYGIRFSVGREGRTSASSLVSRAHILVQATEHGVDNKGWTSILVPGEYIQY